jgi:hypothetical protein
MKSKNFTLIVLIAVIVGVVLWWFTLQPAATPGKSVEVPTPVKTDGPKMAAQVAQVELPLAPAVQPEAETAQAAPIAAAPIAADPQADLKTALPDMARLLRHGGMLELEMAYFQPAVLAAMDPQMVQQMQMRVANTPPEPVSPIYEARAKIYESLANQTPIFNATGDMATYTVVPAMFTSDNVNENNLPTTIMMVKVNGKWYMTNAATEAAIMAQGLR